MIIALLLLIVLLLAGVIWLLVTGWTPGEKSDIEKTGQDIRRELAQHRADSVQLLHSMRIELEESLREAIEQKIDAIEIMQSRGSSRRRRSPAAPKDLPSAEVPAAVNGNGADREEFVSVTAREASFAEQDNDRQFQLFLPPEPQQKPGPSLEDQMRAILENPQQSADVPKDVKPRKGIIQQKEEDDYISMIRVLPDAALYDDIPDVENLPKHEEMDTREALPEPKSVRIKSESYIDDIPDIEDL